MGDLEDILARLQPALGPCTGEPTPLSGGITNRNYRVRLGETEYVIRRHGKDTRLLGIDREAERIASEAAAALGIAPEVVATLADGLVTRFIDCEELAPGEIAARAGELAAHLRAFHDSGVQLPVRFWVPDLLEEYGRLIRSRGRVPPGEYEQAAAIVARIAAALAAWTPCPCHNDLLPGNVIGVRGEGRLMIVDWEYAGMGHRCFDLGNLSVNNDFDAADDERLLAAYHGRPPTDGERAELKLMRLLSDAREGAWGILQEGISELDFDFTGYGEQHLHRLLRGAADADFGAWLAAA